MAVRVVLAQIGISLTLAGLFAVRGLPEAQAALCGGMAVALGSGLLGLRAFAGQAPGARRALAGLLFGLAARWIVVIGAFWLALAHWHLPALPLIAACAAALLVHVFALRCTD